MRRAFAPSVWAPLTAVLLVALTPLPPAHAQRNVGDHATFVYVSMAREQKIQTFRLEPTNGQLTAGKAIAVEGAPGALAVDLTRSVLFASLRTKTTLVSFRIRSDSGSICDRGENCDRSPERR